MAEDSRRGETIILKDEEGYDIEYEYLDHIKHEAKEYIVLLPIEQPVDGGIGVEIVQVTGTEENEEYKQISKDEFKLVFEKYQEKMKDAVDATNIDLSFIGQESETEGE